MFFGLEHFVQRYSEAFVLYQRENSYRVVEKDHMHLRTYDGNNKYATNTLREKRQHQK